MAYPNLKEEKRLWKQGFKKVACLDEAGRGALAGPVTAAAVIMNRRTFLQRRNVLQNIKDSKKLSAKKREELYEIITNHPGIKWGAGRVSERVIDRINIFQATKLAMKRAIRKLEPHYLILDGKMSLNLDIPQKPIVKADEKVFSCALASIVSKVRRDRSMKRYHKKYPQYGFDIHKGYPTDLHVKMLKKYGRCDIHRISFNYGGSQAKTHQVKERQKKGQHLS